MPLPTSKSVLLAVFLCVPALQGASAQALPGEQLPPRTVEPTTKMSPLLDQSVFVLAGQFHAGFFGHSFIPTPPMEHNYLLGLGYQKFYHTDPNGWNFGVEAGIAGRFGKNDSAEIWGGGVARYDGWVINDSLRISPAITFGLSATTDTIGVEKEREAETDQSADILFYLGPELSFSHVDNPENEIFTRIQHRSGAWGATGLAPIDGSNAITLGVRHRF